MNEFEQSRAVVRNYLLAEHRELIATVLTCADSIIDSRPSDTSHTETGFPLNDSLADPLRERLDHAGVIERLPTVLTGAVGAMDASLSVKPVGAPPYVVVANTGPLMRATIDNRRLVITIEAFHVHRDTRQYVRTTNDPEEALSIEIRFHG
jgi:hypothetical protein